MGEVLPATLERSPKNKLCSVLIASPKPPETADVLDRVEERRESALTITRTGLSYQLVFSLGPLVKTKRLVYGIDHTDHTHTHLCCLLVVLLLPVVIKLSPHHLHARSANT